MHQSKIQFNKPPKSPADLIAHLQGKGLIVNSVTLAQKAIAEIGYYRLLLYTRAFQDSSSKQFLSGTTFQNILDVYELDRELRLLCMGPIERIEIALRASIVNELAVQLGSHFYMQRQYFDRKDRFDDFLDSVADLNPKDLPIQHYYSRYNQPPKPPIWVCLECLSFGAVSRMFSNLVSANRTLVSKVFGHNDTVLVSWFRTINELRNDCAHHNTLCTTKFANAPTAVKGKHHLFTLYRNRFSDKAVVVASLMDILQPKHSWKTDLKALFAKYPQVEPYKLGFKANWEQDPFWQ